VGSRLSRRANRRW